MIGQEALQKQIRDWVEVPHTIMLIGDEGMGKRTLIKECIGARLGTDIRDITDKISLSLIERIIVSGVPCLYYINCDLITIREQNILLKFIEEPTDSYYIVLTSSNLANVLDTIVGRCCCLRFEPYTDEELLKFTKDRDVLKIAHTPGKIINLENCDYDKLNRICTVLLTRCDNANFGNMLTLSSQINWKDEPNKFNFDLFLDILSNVCLSMSMENDKSIFSKYLLISKLKSECSIPNVNKQRLFEKFLTELRFG